MTAICPVSELRQFFATAARGTESALAEELEELGLREVRTGSAGVFFVGTEMDAWRCCLWSRIAMAVLMPVAEFEAATAAELYEGAKAIEWTRYLTPDRTFAVRAVGQTSELRHTGYVALKVKDAIVDAVREQYGERPNVSREDPDIRVFVRLTEGRALVALDLAGDPLVRRGYRQHLGPAPLKETLAAAVLRYAGWDRVSPLIDPMCGTGVIPIEAALWAGNRAPGLFRARFGFERWASHGEVERRRMAELRAQAWKQARAVQAEIWGGDISPEALQAARENAKRAGVDVQWYLGDINRMPAPHGRRWIVSNPPYGHRLKVSEPLYARLGRRLARARDAVWAILTGNRNLLEAMPGRPSRIRRLHNGPIACDLAIWDPIARAPGPRRPTDVDTTMSGSRRRRRPDPCSRPNLPHPW